MQLNQYKLQREIGKVGAWQGWGGVLQSILEYLSSSLMELAGGKGRARTPQPDWEITRGGQR